MFLLLKSVAMHQEQTWSCCFLFFVLFSTTTPLNIFVLVFVSEFKINLTQEVSELV